VTRRAIPALLCAALVAAALAVPVVAAGLKTVKVHDSSFSPKSVRVQHGTTVRWSWASSLTHNVTLIKGPRGVAKSHSRNQDHGSYSRKLTTRGTYTFECTIHGFTMTVHVT
jgi:plastocyanin